MKLKPCPFCGNTKPKIVYTRGTGIPSGQDGWYATIKCDCPVYMHVWALKKDWATASLTEAWNRRTKMEVTQDAE